MRKHLFKALHFSVKNTIRGLFFASVMAAFAMGMCWFLALKYFNAQNVGGAIARELGNALQRPVVIGSIKLVSINSIEIKKFKVVDTKLNTYNDFLSADSVIVRYDLLPLLKNKVEIKEIILQNPVVNIIKDENGALNTPDFITSTTQSSRGQQFDVMREQTVRHVGVLQVIHLGGRNNYSLHTAITQVINQCVIIREYTDPHDYFVHQFRLIGDKTTKTIMAT